MVINIYVTMLHRFKAIIPQILEYQVGKYQMVFEPWKEKTQVSDNLSGHLLRERIFKDVWLLEQMKNGLLAFRGESVARRILHNF